MTTANSMSRMKADEEATPAVQRIGLLRRSLRALGLDGLVVPMSDPHHTEWLSEGSDRLSWLTGFSGSAGTAVVFQDRAIFLTDGRYMETAAAELPTGVFEIVNIGARPLGEAAADLVRAGEMLGVDPWLHSHTQMEALSSAVYCEEGRLISVRPNPIDSLRQSIGIEMPHQAFAHPGLWSGRDSRDKRREIAASLERAGADALLISQPESVCWLLNVRGRDDIYTPLVFSFALLRVDGSVVWFVDPRKTNADLLGVLGKDVLVRPYEAVLESLTGGAGKRLWIDADATSAALTAAARERGWMFHFERDPCLVPKAVKNSVELDGARSAHERDGAALTKVLAWIDQTASVRPVLESEIGDRTIAERARLPLFHGPSFEPIPGSGPNAALPHYHVTPSSDRSLQAGEFLLLDSGGQYLDGTTDVTRTLQIGAVSDEMRQRYTLVLRAFLRASMARFPVGTRGIQIDAIARHLFWACGTDYDHSTGHGVGSFLGVHEGPNRLRPTLLGLEPLQLGMVTSIEPAYYARGRFGVRIENLVAVRESPPRPDDTMAFLEFEPLTLAPIDLRPVLWEQLSIAETDWLDHYHQRVSVAIGPQLEPSEKEWLSAQIDRIPAFLD